MAADDDLSSSDDEDRKDSGRHEDRSSDRASEGDDDNGTKNKKPSPVVRIVVLCVAVVAVILGALWFINWWNKGRYFQSTNDAYLRADQVTVAPKVQGYVTRVFVRDNQDVQVGQILVQIDARQYQASVDQAQATILAREADIKTADAQIRQQQAAVAQAQAQLASANTSAAYAQSQVKRYQPLVAGGSETAEHLAQLVAQRDQAVADGRARAAAVEQARRQIGTLSAQIGQAQAQVQAAKASAAGVKLNVADTDLRAGISGRIGDKTVQQGQYVAPGTRLMSIVPVSQIYLVANFKETQVGLMRAGQPVEVKVDTLRGVKIRGVVESFSPGTGAQFALLPPENATGNFTKIVQRVPVRIRLSPPRDVAPLLLPGLSVTATVNTIAAKDDMKHIKQESKAQEPHS